MVTFRIRHYRGGSVRLTVFDSEGLAIFDDDEIDDYVAFTGRGTPGLWLIRLEFELFSGSLYITLEQEATD